MDPILQILLSWQFIFFGLAVAAIMYILRTLVEYCSTLLKKSLDKSVFWNDVFLPIFPVILGATSAFFLKLFPYPGFANGPKGYVLAGDRIIFGLVAGLLSTTMYRVIKSILSQKITSTAQTISETVSQLERPMVVNDAPETISENEISQRGKL